VFFGCRNRGWRWCCSAQPRAPDRDASGIRGWVMQCPASLGAGAPVVGRDALRCVPISSERLGGRYGLGLGWDRCCCGWLVCQEGLGLGRVGVRDAQVLQSTAAPTRRGCAAWQALQAGSTQPPATMRTISRRSPSRRGRSGNSEGATASPLCSTTTLFGRSPWAIRNDSIVQGKAAAISLPLAMTVTGPG